MEEFKKEAKNKKNPEENNPIDCEGDQYNRKDVQTIDIEGEQYILDDIPIVFPDHLNEHNISLIDIDLDSLYPIDDCKAGNNDNENLRIIDLNTSEHNISLINVDADASYMLDACEAENYDLDENLNSNAEDSLENINDNNVVLDLSLNGHRSYCPKKINDFLLVPLIAKRKGKRYTERSSYAITSHEWQLKQTKKIGFGRKQ